MIPVTTTFLLESKEANKRKKEKNTRFRSNQNPRWRQKQRISLLINHILVLVNTPATIEATLFGYCLFLNDEVP